MKIKRKSEDEYLDFVMKAGAPLDIFKTPNFKQIFLRKCAYISNKSEGNNFKVMYRKFLQDIDFIPNIDLILFGQNLLDYQDKYYLPYIYYLENENVKFKKISADSYFRFEDITFEDLQKIYIKSGNQNLIELLLEKISDPKQNYYLFGNRNDIFWKLVNQLNIKMMQQYPPQQYPPQQYPPQQYPPQQYPPQQYPPQQYSLQQYPPQQNPPQQYSPQQFQEKSPQMQSQNKINELKQQLATLINTQKSILEKMGTNPTNANKIELQELTQIQEILEQSIRNELQKIETNPITQSFQKDLKNNKKAELQKLLQNLLVQKKQIENIQNKQIFNITKKNSTNKYSSYRCEDPSLEVKIQDNTNIFFGYDENLFIKAQNGSYKFYYKYSYRNGKFMQLTKNQNEILEEKEINIDLIPTYDILCLYFAAVKDLRNRTELVTKLNLRIDKAKENISKTAEAFFKLEHSNFDKENIIQQPINSNPDKKKITNGKYKNFGKVKKRRVTEKTYIFFGARNSPGNIRNNESKFGFVCFREDDKVFYYEKGKLNEKKPLFNFPFIFPLEDLIAFILLRRMITDEKKFADVIYNKATARIKFLKTQKIAEKMLVKQFPEEYQSFQGQPRRAIQQSQQISLLPRSSNQI